jgi:hypothetical protein
MVVGEIVNQYVAKVDWMKKEIILMTKKERKHESFTTPL